MNTKYAVHLNLAVWANGESEDDAIAKAYAYIEYLLKSDASFATSLDFHGIQECD